jgi:hypothetical protein
MKETSTDEFCLRLNLSNRISSRTKTLFTSWHSLCLSINNTGQAVYAWINGEKISINVDQTIFFNTFSLLEPALKVGNFTGLMTDLHVWNFPLSSEEIKNFSTGCNQDFPKANAIYWPTAQLRKTGNKAKMILVQKTLLCVKTLNGKNESFINYFTKSNPKFFSFSITSFLSYCNTEILVF